MAGRDRPSEARCICGKVSLRFLRSVPVLHVHCCCADCRQGREWIAREGGPPLTRAVTLVDYFVNDLAPLDSDALKLLFTVKLRETGRTVRLVTRCCHSVVAIDHPYYDKNVVCVHVDACELVAPRIAPLSRIFTSAWDAASDGEMPPETAALEDSDAMWDEFARIVKQPPGPASGVRLQEILAELPPATVLGLEEGARLLPRGKN